MSPGECNCPRVSQWFQNYWVEEVMWGATVLNATLLLWIFELLFLLIVNVPSTNSSFYLCYYLTSFLFSLLTNFPLLLGSALIPLFSLWFPWSVTFSLPYLHSCTPHPMCARVCAYVWIASQCGSPLKYSCAMKAWGNPWRVAGKDLLRQATRLWSNLSCWYDQITTQLKPPWGLNPQNGLLFTAYCSWFSCFTETFN